MDDRDGNGGLSDYVRRVMKRKGLTLRDIERKSGGRITDGYVSAIISGEATNLTVEKLKALADGLGLEAGVLFEVACGNKDTFSHQAAPDPSHSLMVLALMQKVVVSTELTEILEEVVQLAPEDRQMVLRSLKTLNESGSSSKGNRIVI